MPKTDASDCRSWYRVNGIVAYHDLEWGRPCHDDRTLFEMLCLEGASVGLSFRTIYTRRDAYRTLFHNFDIDACAAMSDEELELACMDARIIRARAKVRSVRSNARAVQVIQREHGSFDAYLRGLVGPQVVGRWERMDEVPVRTDLSERVAFDLKRRGISFVGPIITYSYLQATGFVCDHLLGCDCRDACIEQT